MDVVSEDARHGEAKLRGFVLSRKLCNGRAADRFEPEGGLQAAFMLEGSAMISPSAPDLEALRAAAARRPAYPRAFLELGETLGAVGRIGEAIAAFEDGLRAFPTADGFRISLGYLHLRRNDRAAARAMFEHVRTVAPGRQDAMVGLAQVLALEGDHGGAVSLFRQALVIRPDNAGARIALAKSLLELGDREAGEAELKRAAAQAPELAGPILSALAAAPRGRFFLRPSAARDFLKA